MGWCKDHELLILGLILLNDFCESGVILGGLVYFEGSVFSQDVHPVGIHSVYDHR